MMLVPSSGPNQRGRPAHPRSRPRRQARPSRRRATRSAASSRGRQFPRREKVVCFAVPVASSEAGQARWCSWMLPQLAGEGASARRGMHQLWDRLGAAWTVRKRSDLALHDVALATSRFCWNFFGILDKVVKLTPRKLQCSCSTHFLPFLPSVGTKVWVWSSSASLRERTTARERASGAG